MLQSSNYAYGKTRPRSREKSQCLSVASPSIDQLVSVIIRDCGNSARVLELYYWSQQAGFTEAARVLSGLTPHTRHILQTFLTMGNPSDIIARVGEFGDLHLCSNDIGNVMHKMRIDEEATAPRSQS